jgi:deoxyribose-phosphate aldolase
MIYIARRLEHTALKQGMTEINIRDNLELCSGYGLPVIVVPPSFVKYTAENKKDSKLKVCTVIGFPLGYNTAETKIFEISNAIENGADEIDLVIDNSLIKDNSWDELERRLKLYRQASEGRTLKVIVETSLLNRSELDRTVRTLIGNSIDYIKTSTGFVGEGARLDDIKFLKDFFGSQIKIKASGGIKTKAFVIELIEAGVDRIGTSSTKQILEN